MKILKPPTVSSRSDIAQSQVIFAEIANVYLSELKHINQFTGRNDYSERILKPEPKQVFDERRHVHKVEARRVGPSMDSQRPAVLGAP